LSKGSYLKKHSAHLKEEGLLSLRPSRKINISPDLKAELEEGKVLLLDKPIHWTSFDVVKKIRSAIRIKKVGHAGTLDPLASGLLIICTGKYTKKINDYMAQRKEYTGSFTLGAVTPTYDLESLPEQQKDISSIDEKMILEASKKFIGEIDQFPPIYSALKQEGKPLYELARTGKDIDLKPRRVSIVSFEIIKIDLPKVEFKVVCSTGTYIRSLANDFGLALNCGAYLSGLRRTAIGEFKVENSVGVDEFLDSINQNIC
jgi:tRNA pseudouridine55 synthase